MKNNKKKLLVRIFFTYVYIILPGYIKIFQLQKVKLILLKIKLTVNWFAVEFERNFASELFIPSAQTFTIHKVVVKLSESTLNRDIDIILLYKV